MLNNSNDAIETNKFMLDNKNNINLEFTKYFVILTAHCSPYKDNLIFKKANRKINNKNMQLSK